MKVKILKTGETATYNDEYAQRLIEQGKAVPVEEKKAEEPKKAEETSPVFTGKKK